MVTSSEFDIAIIGMSGRFPGAGDIGEFWRNLAGGVESISALSDEEMLAGGVPAAYLSDPAYVKVAPVLEQPGHFDAGFFGYSPMEARSIDPQQRILLELAVEAIEHAGCDTDRYPGRVGVFTGSALNTYYANTGLNHRLAKEYIPTLISNDKDFLSTRISYKLNLTGPSLTVQTACSTSMVAVHLACQSLLSQESDMALAGAVAVRVPHRAGYFCDGGGVVSPDGHVRSFDASANGTVFGSGGGMLVLKRMADALAEGDTIHAVIKGSAVNNDGSEKAGYTAPSVNAQASVVVEALANAGVDADSISYVEAHGSGTPLGDPIEIRALTKAFRNFTQRSAFCAIGSVKTNVGHLDAAAAVTGIIKTVLALAHRQLPPSLHYTRANPEIDFPASPFFVNDSLSDWASDGPRRAGVMSTGMGGTNAHLILEEAPRQAKVAQSNSPHLLVWSAKTESALGQATQRLRGFFRDAFDHSSDINPDINPDISQHKSNEDGPCMGDVAHTLQQGRKAYPYRRCLVCADPDDALAALDEEGSRRLMSGHAGGSRRPLVLLLPGVGDHYVGMAHGLYRDWPEFRRQVDHCAQILEPHLGVDIREILYPPGHNWNPANKPAGIDLKKMLGRKSGEAAEEEASEEDGHSRTLNQTLMAQPALFTIEYAMVRLWQSLGVSPDGIVGHSMGEYVAACVAGVMTLEDALGLIATRARLVSDLPQGGMLAVMMPEADLQLLMPELLSVSLINGPNLCVAAGPVEAVTEFEKTLDEMEIISRRVQNAHAFHSAMMMPVMTTFEHEVSKIRLNAPVIPFMSNVSGSWITANEATSPAYWSAHLAQTARFSDALQELWQLDNPILLEAGPGRTLTMLAMQHPARQKSEDPVTLASIRHHYDNQADDNFLCQAIGRLWLAGSDIQWQHLPGAQGRRKIPLPQYPFDRQLHWLEPVAEKESHPDGPILKDPDPGNWLYISSWNRVLARCSGRAEESAGNWLLYADDSRLSDELTIRLECAGHTVVRVRAGSHFRQDNPHDFTIEPANPGHYDRLIHALKQSELLPDRIVHAWNAGMTTASAANACDFAPAQDQGFFSLVFLVKALAAHNVRHEMRLWVLSDGVQDVSGRETLHPERATLLAPCLVIRQEYPNIHVQSIDVDSSALVMQTVRMGAVDGDSMDTAEDRTPEPALELLLGELLDPDSSQFIAHRNGQRWVQTYPRIAARDFKGKHSAFRHGGVYLITGGLGNIGMTIARHLAENYQARLTLVGRTAIPARNGWEKWTDEHGTDDPVSLKIRDLRAIEQLGGEVLYAQADVADATAMRGVVDQTCKKFGALHGAIHGAGIVGQRAYAEIKDCDQAACKEHFQAKVYGLLALESALDGRVTDFCLLLSSLASVLGGIGQVAYAACNIFMDNFARKISRHSTLQWLSINWDVWRLGDDATFASGMGTTLDGLGMSAAEAAQTMTCALALKTASQVVVSTADLEARIDQWVNLKSLDSNAQSPADSERADLQRAGPDLARRPELHTLFDAPRSETERQVARIWQQTLGIDAVGTNDNFAELGGHSLLAVRIVAELRKAFEIDLPVRVLFDAPTVAEVSRYIERLTVAELETAAGSGSIGIPVRADRQLAPLSSTQRQMWFIDQMTPGNPAYNLPYGLRFHGALDTAALEAGFNQIIARHETLRTTFSVVEGEPQQRVQAEFNIAIKLVPLEQLSEKEREARLHALASEESLHAFDLSRLPLIRVTLFRLGPTDHVLVVNMHHILADGLSVGLLFTELDAFYRAIKHGGTAPVPELTVQYGDFAAWQQQSNEAVHPAQIEFWQAQLGGDLPVLELATDHSRPALQSFRGSNVFCSIPATLTQELKAIGGREGCTLFMTLLAAFTVLLQRYSGAEEMVIGTPVSTRGPAGFEPLIGNFLNMTALRCDLSGDPTFVELLRRSRKTTLDAISNSNVSFETVMQLLQLDRDPSRNPVFQALFELLPPQSARLDDLQVSEFGFDLKFAQLDLSLHLCETGGGCQGRFEYCTDLFERSTIERLAANFELMLGAIAHDAHQKLAEITLLSPTERSRMLGEWNDTASELPDKTAAELFEAQVKRSPGQIAVHFGARAISYAELNAHANRIAHTLRSRGITRGQRVGLCVERGGDMLAAMLAILKSGAAYVPLDPAFPAARLTAMAEDARLSLLVSTSGVADFCAVPRARQLLLDEDAATIAAAPDSGLPAASGSAHCDDPAYLIYTSGSTGTPKGVVVPHRALTNFLTSMSREPGLDADDVLVAVTTLSFDIAVLELLLPLIVGATVVIAPREVAMDADALRSLLESQHATIMQATPVTWRLLLDSGWTGRASFKALAGGEALPRDLAAQLIACDVELWNMYGPTETTVWSTCARITDPAAAITIGKPIANTTVRVLDVWRGLCAVGVPGELCIGGAGVALGYWERPALTADQFIPDPFTDDSDARLYRTGDRVRWRADGTLEHLGRLDYQIKLRGFRIEAGEIEAGIAQHPAVRECVVVAQADASGDKRLVAYVLASDPPHDLDDQLRARLRAAMPEYMVPAYFVLLDELPRTENGKLDRKALPVHHADKQDRYGALQAPRTATEQKVMDVFSDVLKRNSFGIEDNFFNLGGNSLMAARMVLRLRAETNLDVPLRVLFERQTVSSLAAAIDELDWVATSRQYVDAGTSRVEFEL